MPRVSRRAGSPTPTRPTPSPSNRLPVPTAELMLLAVSLPREWIRATWGGAQMRPNFLTNPISCVILFCQRRQLRRLPPVCRRRWKRRSRRGPHVGNGARRCRRSLPCLQKRSRLPADTQPDTPALPSAAVWSFRFCGAPPPVQIGGLPNHQALGCHRGNLDGSDLAT